MAINNLQNRFLQPLRSNILASYEQAIDALNAVAAQLDGIESADGTQIVARYNTKGEGVEGNEVKSIFGIYSSKSKKVTIYSADIEKIAAIEDAIADAEKAAKAAATKLVLPETEAFLELNSVTGANGEITYTLNSKDIASATATTQEFEKVREEIDAVEAAAKSYSIVEVEDELGENVLKAYQLQETVGETSKKVGSVIEIYKDSSLEKVELVEQELQFTYILANGDKSTVGIDVSKFLAETEFSEGLQVIGGVVSVKIDAASESFLTVSENGIKLSGVQEAINAAQGAAEGAAAKALEDANKYTDGKIGALNYTLAKEEGKAIVSVSQTDGVIAAEYGDIAASHVTVTPTNGIASTTVQDALVELDGEIATLNAAAVKSIEVNGVASSELSESGAASVTIDGTHIALGEYTSVEYAKAAEAAGMAAVATGSTVNGAIAQLDSNIAKLADEVLANEEVCAAAITKIKESVGLDENLAYAGKGNYIDGSTVVADALSLLDAAINDVADALSLLDAAINDVSDKVGALTNGPQGVSTLIANAIAELDGTATSTNGSYVNITVNEVDGKLTTASVNETKLVEKFNAIDAAIAAADKAAKAAKSVVLEGDTNDMLSVTPETDEETGAVTYTVDLSNVWDCGTFEYTLD